MIFKKVKARARDGSGRYRYRRAAHLMNYVQKLAAEGGEQGAVYMCDRGFLNDSDTAAHAAELHGLIHSCARARNPIRHYVLSWRPDEQPSREQVDQAVDVFLEKAGWTRHLVRYAQHNDTDCAHVHLVVCTIDPLTEKVRDVPRGLDIEVGHRAVARIEALQGWRPTDGAVKRHEREAKGEQKPAADPRAIAPEVRAKELATGIESATRRAQAAAQLIATAKTWKQLHTELSTQGLSYQIKGSGAVIRVDTRDRPPAYVKASDVSRSAARAAMEKRLGAYQSPTTAQDTLATTAPPEAKQAPTPGAATGTAWFQRRKLWAAYQSEQQAVQDRRSAALRRFTLHNKASLEQARWIAKTEAAAMRLAMRHLPLSRLAKRALLDELYSAGRAEVKALRATQAAAVRAAMNRPDLRPLPRWSDVVVAHGADPSGPRHQSPKHDAAAAFVERLLAPPADIASPRSMSAEVSSQREPKDHVMTTAQATQPVQPNPYARLDTLLAKEPHWSRGAPSSVIGGIAEREQGDDLHSSIARLDSVLSQLQDATLEALDAELAKIQKKGVRFTVSSTTTMTPAVWLIWWLIELFARLFRRREIGPLPVLGVQPRDQPEDKEALRTEVLYQARHAIGRIRLNRSLSLQELDSRLAEQAIKVSSAATGVGAGMDWQQLAAGKRALAEALLAEAAALESSGQAPERDLSRSHERQERPHG
jgi:hypothetical protein